MFQFSDTFVEGSEIYLTMKSLASGKKLGFFNIFYSNRVYLNKILDIAVQSGGGGDQGTRAPGHGFLEFGIRRPEEVPLARRHWPAAMGERGPLLGSLKVVSNSKTIC